MNTFFATCKRAAAVLLVCATLSVSVRAGVDDFTLTKAIPADAIVAVHTRKHAGGDFVRKQYERVWKAAAAQGFDRDLKRIIRDGIKEEGGDLVQFDTEWDKFAELWNQLDVSAMCGSESAFAMAMSNKLPEFIMLSKLEGAALDKNYPVLSNMFKALANVSASEFQATEDADGDLKLTRLSAGNSPVPFSFVVGRTKDLLIFGMGGGWVEQCIAMARGETGPSLASTPRFQAAFKRLTPGKDQIAFVDVGRLVDSVRGLLDMIPDELEAASSQPSEPSPMQVKAVMKKLIDGVDLWDYVASTETTEGMKTSGESLVVLRDNASTRMLYPVWYGNDPIKNPFKYVPIEAGDVMASSGVDLLKFYQTAIKFIQENLPESEAMLAEWNATQEEMQINVEKDLLSWISGGMTSFSIPGATPYTPAESMFMLAVRDEAKAKSMLDKLFETVGPMAEQQQAQITDLTSEGLPGFRSVSHPIVMMIMKEPTIGVRDGYLMLGASPKVIQKALDTAAGKNADFSKNERYKKEGISVTGNNVVAFSFADQTQMAEQMSQAFKMAPFIASMMGGGKQPPQVKAMLSILNKVGNVVEKLDFFLSESSVSTFDGKVEITKTVTNYREPPSKATSQPSKSDKPAKPEKKE